VTTETGERLSTGEALRAALFYVAIAALLIVCTTRHTADVFPNRLAHRIGDNSEAYLLAGVACLWLHFVRREAQRRGIGLIAGVVGGLVCLVLGIIFKKAGWPSSVGTLNEAWFGLAFLLPYFMLPRPIRWAALFSLALVIGLLIANDTSIVIKGAESWMVLVLAPLGFDVFDRAILDRGARESQLLRLLWMAILIAVPLLAAALRHHVGHGHVNGIRDYISRANEAFIGLLIIHAYCGYWARSALAGRRSPLLSSH
jgi:hypothetical protein